MSCKAEPRFWMAALYTEFNGNFRMCFWKTTCSRKNFSVLTRNCHETWRRSETRTANFYETDSTISKNLDAWNATRRTGRIYYSQNCAMEAPRYAFSELHFGKFPDPDDFQYWSVSFKTERRVRFYSWTHHVVDQWSGDGWIFRRFSDVEFNYSRVFSWFWDAWCKDCVCVKKDHLQYLFQKKESALKSSELRNTTDSWEEGKLLFWSMSTFSQPELMIQLQVWRICVVFAHMMMTSKISTQDEIRSYCEQVRCLWKMFPKFSR